MRLGSRSRERLTASTPNAESVAIFRTTPPVPRWLNSMGVAEAQQASAVDALFPVAALDEAALCLKRLDVRARELVGNLR